MAIKVGYRYTLQKDMEVMIIDSRHIVGKGAVVEYLGADPNGSNMSLLLVVSGKLADHVGAHYEMDNHKVRVNPQVFSESISN